jgi:hypothetical protein
MDLLIGNWLAIVLTWVSVGEIVELSTISGVARRASCQCQRLGLLFEHLFEYPQESPRRVKMSVPEINPAHDVIADGSATPIEFTFRGKRFRIHAVLSRWCEAGGWWNRVSDGIYRPDDGARALWTVEAAPIGALNTFQLERDEITGFWIVKQV